MVYMATAAEKGYEAVKVDLARAIRKRRSDCIPGETARQILAYDSPDHAHLVGIDHLGEKAIFYSCGADEVIFVRFGPNGLADGGPCMGSFRRGAGLEAWIEKMAAYWGWLHPRYR